MCPRTLLTYLSSYQDDPLPFEDVCTSHTPPPDDSVLPESRSLDPSHSPSSDLPGSGLLLGDTNGSRDNPDALPTSALDTQAPIDPSSNASDILSGDTEDLWDRGSIRLGDLKLTADFIKALQEASLDDPNTGMSSDALERLRNPLHEQPSLLLNKDTRLALKLFLANPSEITYELNRAAILDCYPDTDLPTYYRTTRLVADITGIESIVHHMCVNSCIAYTGPFLDLLICPICSEPRYDQFRLETSNGTDKIPRQEFHTIPIGPQLQALYREPESATHAHYLREERSRILSEIQEQETMSEYTDVLHGTDLIEAFQDERIGEDDIVLMFSIDGAQLYAKKASACWIYIWVLLNLAPDRRYKKKHVFIGGFIPGPNNPKNTDSFLFPGLHHICALQKEKLKLWDAALQREVESKVFLALLTADGPGMMHVTGLVGYHGKHGCRLYCGLAGRREPQGKQYFPALLKPSNYDVEGCTHGDIDIRHLPDASCEKYKVNLRFLVASANESQYRSRRLATGISKPSIFLGLDQSSTLALPKSAGSDIMHLGALNLSDLMISLWRGTIDCTKPDDKSTWTWAVLRGDVWQQHGKAVADALHYLPSSFDRPPRNIAEKLTSGYKAWEFLLYLYGLGPGLLYGILPYDFYANYCKLVYGMRLMNQHRITKKQVSDALLALTSFAQEFEIIYCQRLPTRIHFVRLCVHSLVHLPREVVRLGPPVCSSQWTLERTIGNLGEEIKQHSNPFANLSQRGIRRARTNALYAMIPDLDANRQAKSNLPRGARDTGDGFILLRARDRNPHTLRECEAEALRKFLHTTDTSETVSVYRWAKLRIPTGQICYSSWKEMEKPLLRRRTARNVKVFYTSLMISDFNYLLTYATLRFYSMMKFALQNRISIYMSIMRDMNSPSHLSHYILSPIQKFSVAR